MFSDVVYDTSGGTLKGLVVEEHADRIVLSTEERERTVFRSRIEEVFYAEPERNYLYLGNQALEQGDFGAARGFFQKALQINPAFSEAADAIERAADLAKKQDWVSEGLDLLQALERQWGITLAEGEEGPAVVREVRSGSLAARSGVHAGDGLVAVWSSSLAFLPAGVVAKELIGPPGGKVKLTLRREVPLPPGFPEINLSMERLGLTAAAQGAGLLAGDRIVSIDGKSTRYMPLEEARRRIRAGRGKGAALVIHRDLRVTRQ